MKKNSKAMRLLAGVLVASLATPFGLMPQQAVAAGQGILAIVNDTPITGLDIDEQVRLLEILGARVPARKAVLNDLINQVVKVEESKRFKMNPTDVEIDARLAEMAKGLKTDRPGLEKKLEKQGISIDMMKQYVSAQIGFARLLRYKYKQKVEIKKEDVDLRYSQVQADLNSKLKKVMADPRMRPIRVVSLMEIKFPIEKSEMSDELLQSRALEASQFMKKFSGCKSARAAAAGIFNVQIGKTIEADAAKLPKPLRAALEAKGQGQAIGPMRAGNAIQVVGYCSARTITPPKPHAEMPTRQQVEQVVINERYSAVESKYMALMRKNAVIEYKDPSFSQ